MRATARRDDGKLQQPSRSASTPLTADEPKDQGGDDSGPEPAGAAGREPR